MPVLVNFDTQVNDMVSQLKPNYIADGTPTRVNVAPAM